MESLEVKTKLIKQKNRNLKVRVSKEKRIEIDKFCAKNGVKISPYLRTIIDQSEKKEIKIITSKEAEIFSNIGYELQKIGININQIAHFFNLKHLKLLDNGISNIEDLVMVDKCKKEQLEEIVNLLKGLENKVVSLTNELSVYDKK